jgi:hypothetical protein
MAQQPYGVSFLPNGDQRYQRPGTAGASPVQEAIKVLSLRVPRVVGSTPLAPLALLTGQGGGGAPSGVVETLLRALAPPQSPATPPVAAVPSPATLPQAASVQAPAPAQPATPPLMGARTPTSAPAGQSAAPASAGLSPELTSLAGAQAAQMVRPQVSGAPSGAPAAPPSGAFTPYTQAPTPNITIGEQPGEATTYTPPSQRLTPGGPNENDPDFETRRLLQQAAALMGRQQRGVF